jgi:DNA-binding NarL/FixJ family response regulator
MPKCILLVDDNPAIRTSLHRFFERQTEFEVCGEASDGEEAISKSLELRPDLIIMDLSMPGMNGLAAGRKLKALLPSVPMILYTMYANPASEAIALEAGFSAVVSKTDGLNSLVNIVQSLLEPVG